jgi:hypothetical protein
MDWVAAPDHWWSRLVIQRGTAAIYLIAFLVARNQFRPLLGEHGLLPVPRYLRVAGWRAAPSLFQWGYSDGRLAAVAWAGIVLSAAALLGLPEEGPAWVSLLVWLALWALYLSIVNVGQIFYGFGWESLLLEAGFLVAFLGPADTAPPTLVLWLIRWLVFRLEFGAGLIKIRGDRCWRDLTCLHHHHETQPMPNPFSWFFHRLPGRLHKVEVAANHFTQLVVPFFLFAPQPVATVAAVIILVTQSWLVLSGNFSWLNWLTLVLSVAAISFGEPAGRDLADPAAWSTVLVIALTVMVAVLSWWPVRNLLSRRQLMNFSFNRLHLVNAYGAFGSVTRVRHEVVIEGTADPSGATGWQEYEFKAKPGDVRRRPPQFAPYHLRLDWLMWFAGISPSYAESWFGPLLQKLLEGDPAVLALLRHDPFPDAPPALVRARLYRYRFTTWRERRQTGAWWVRTEAGHFAGPVRLRPST